MSGAGTFGDTAPLLVPFCSRRLRFSRRQPFLQRHLESHADRVGACDEGAAVNRTLRIGHNAGQRGAQRAIRLGTYLAGYRNDFNGGAAYLQKIAAAGAEARIHQAAQRTAHEGIAEALGQAQFLDAEHKIFLTASAEERARRRYKQLKEKGLTVTLSSLLREIEARDERDATRKVAPLKPAAGAVVIDSTAIPIDQVIARVLAVVRPG